MAESDARTGRPLDDVMIAMDVVDTLRHDKRIVERELNVDDRRAELIEELRKIYKDQGIDVPDRILEDAARRFIVHDVVRVTWTPSRFARSLSRLYGTALPPGSAKCLCSGPSPARAVCSM